MRFYRPLRLERQIRDETNAACAVDVAADRVRYTEEKLFNFAS